MWYETALKVGRDSIKQRPPNLTVVAFINGLSGQRLKTLYTKADEIASPIKKEHTDYNVLAIALERCKPGLQV